MVQNPYIKRNKKGRRITSIAIAMAKAKFKVEQEDKAPKREHQRRQGKLTEAPSSLAVVSATLASVFVIFIVVIIIDVLVAFGIYEGPILGFLHSFSINSHPHGPTGL